jgi:hypothetical protein
MHAGDVLGSASDSAERAYALQRIIQQLGSAVTAQQVKHDQRKD